jgi:hypothetical protein
MSFSDDYSESEDREWPDGTTTTDGEYRFDFGKYTGYSLEDVWLEDPECINWIISTWIQGLSCPLVTCTDLLVTLRNVPEEFLEQQPAIREQLERSGARPSILEHYEDTPHGRIWMNKRSSQQRFWEVRDLESIKSTFKEAPPPIVEEIVPFWTFCKRESVYISLSRRQSYALTSNTRSPGKPAL